MEGNTFHPLGHLPPLVLVPVAGFAAVFLLWENEGRFAWSRSTFDALDDCLWSELVEDGRVLLHSTQQATLEPGFHPSPVSGANMEHVSDSLQTGVLHKGHLYIVSLPHCIYLETTWYNAR